MSKRWKQYYYKNGFESLDGKNPHCPHSKNSREKYYLFNAGVIDRLNGYEYDNKAFL